jgi:hypothetical protein
MTRRGLDGAVFRGSAAVDCIRQARRDRHELRHLVGCRLRVNVTGAESPRLRVDQFAKRDGTKVSPCIVTIASVPPSTRNRVAQ